MDRFPPRGNATLPEGAAVTDARGRRPGCAATASRARVRVFADLGAGPFPQGFVRTNRSSARVVAIGFPLSDAVAARGGERNRA